MIATIARALRFAWAWLDYYVIGYHSYAERPRPPQWRPAEYDSAI